MSITFVQTSDPFRYYAMLQETSRTIRHYCLVNGFQYEQYVGVKRGHMLWQSTFNRAYQLYEMLDRGVSGWVFYLDADAFIIDQKFDLAGYLADKSRYGAIFAGYIIDMYDVNAGGFAVNLSHPAGQALVHAYHRRCEQLAGDGYHRALSWDHDVTDDQAILHGLLKSWGEYFGFADAFLFERNDQSHVNNGPFISQQLRSLHRSFDARRRHSARQRRSHLDLTSIDEWRLVRGFDTRTIANIRSLVTVHVLPGQFDPRVARPEVLALIAASTANAAVAAIDRAREQSGQRTAIAFSEPKDRIARPLSLTVDARLPDGRAVRRNVVLLTGDAVVPYVVIAAD